MPDSPQGAATLEPATRREQFSWAMYDFANSGYTTVVMTTIFSAYFVGVVAAGNGMDKGAATFLWTLAVAVGNAIVLFSGPVIGAIADRRASKKQFLMFSTVGCVLGTVALGFAGEGDITATLLAVVFSLVMFSLGENLISAFLPEIATQERMGRLSGYAWGLGYFGGLLTLACCLGWITFAKGQGHSATDFVPVTLWITAAIFALAALPTFLWLRERATPTPLQSGGSYLRASFTELRRTLSEARRFKDLFRFLIVLVIFQAGVNTVIVVAAIYAQEVMGFTSDQLIIMIMAVNLTAAVGALAMGHFQDRFGSVRALALALVIWIAAVLLVMVAETEMHIWIGANLIGLALGSSQSAGRALIGLFTPVARTGEFFGLWGLSARLATIIGPMSYGAISYLTDGDQRKAVLSTLVFFVVGLLLLVTIDEERGKRAVHADG